MPFTMRQKDRRGMKWGILLSLVALAGATFGIYHLMQFVSDKPPKGNHLHIENVAGVQCVIYKAPNRGGVSCNWEKYNQR